MGAEEQEPLDDLKDFLEDRAKQQAAAPAAAPAAQPKPFGERHPRLLAALQLAVLAGAAGYVYASFPELKAASRPERQVRFGVYDTDAAAEKCIAALWKAAGTPGSPKGACPVSGLPYKAEGRKIGCPDPGKHGLAELYFSPEKGVVARREK